MSWPTIFAGLGAVAMFALGFNTIVPLSDGVDTVCDLAGIVCVMLFFGIADDSESRRGRFLELDRE